MADENQDQASAVQGATQALTDTAKNLFWKRFRPIIIIYTTLAVAIVVAALAIYSLISGGISGTTPARLTDPNSATDRQLKLETQANAGDKSAVVQLTGELSAEILSNEAQAFLDAAEASGDEETIALAQTTYATVNALGSGNVASDIRNVKALAQIADPEDPLSRDGILRAVELSTEQARAVVETAKNLRLALDRLYAILVSIENPRLVINERDKIAIRNDEIDVRVLKTLNYLVRPVELGGAGHEKIKVLRIKHTYENERNQYSYEWGEDPGQEEKISPHARGQAFDISVIDTVKRGLFKKSIAKGKKRKVQASRDILVSLQSKDQGRSRSVPGAESDGDTFMDMFENAAMSNLLTQIEENTGYDLTTAKKSAGNIGVIAQNVGLAMLAQEFELPIDPAQDNSSLEKLTQNIGRNYGAQCLALPVDSLRGENPIELRRNIGQALIEQRLGLLPRSLTGNNPDAILSSVGRRKIESSLKLKPMSLEFLRAGDAFNTFVGQVVLEQTLGLPGGSFYSNNLAQIKTSIGQEKFDTVFGMTGSTLETGDKSDKIDQLLSLDKYTRYTHLMKTGGLSVLAYKNAIGNQHLNTYVRNFRDYPTVSLNTVTTPGVRNAPATINSVYVPSGTDNHQDEVLNIPDGSMARLLAGDYATFISIGKDEFTKRLTSDDDERAVVLAWLDTYRAQDLPLDDVGFLRAISKPDGLGGVIAERLEELRIKSRREIEAKNIAAIETLNAQLSTQRTLLANNIARENSNQRGLNIDEIQKERDRIYDEIARIEKELSAEESDSSQWSFITERELEQNYALPAGTLAALLRSPSQLDSIFQDVGRIRATSKIARIQQSQAASGDAEINEQIDILNQEYSTLLFERELAEEYLARLENGDGVFTNEINTTRSRITELEEQIRNIENEQQALVSPNPLEQESIVFRDNLGICTDSFFTDILLGSDTATSVSNRFKQIGVAKLERTLNLPAEVLDLALNAINRPATKAPDQSPGDIGRNYIEAALDPDNYFASGWMQGETIRDIIDNITRSVSVNRPARNIFDFTNAQDAERYFVSLFGIEAASVAQARELLADNNSAAISGSRSADEKLARHIGTILNNSQERIVVPTGLTRRFIAGDITPQTFIQLISTAYQNHPTIQAQAQRSQNDRDVQTKVKQRLSAHDLGQRTIENMLDPNNTLGSGWFAGASLQTITNEIALRLKGQPRHIFDVLPVRESERLLLRGFGISDNLNLVRLSTVSSGSTGEDFTAYRAMDAFDTRLKQSLGAQQLNALSIPNNFTAQLFTGALSPDAYTKRVGELYLQNKSAGYIGDSLNITKNQSLITKGDVINLLNGDYLETALSIGSRSLDDGLVMPAGTVKALIDNPSLDCQIAVGEDTSGLVRTQSCVENILSSNGKQKLAAYLGIASNVNQSDNTRERIGQAALEQTLYNPVGSQTPRQQQTAAYIRSILQRDGLLQGSLPAGWLSGQDMSEVSRNMAKLLYPNLVNVINQEKGRTDAVLGRPVLATAESILLALFGFIPPAGESFDFYSLEGLDRAAWQDTQNGLAQIGNTTDDVLGIERGSTQALFTNAISVAEYKRRVATAHTENALSSGLCNSLIDMNQRGVREGKIQSILEKHNLDCETVALSLRDPDQLQDTILTNILPPRDLGILLGLSSYFDLKIPIKGGFTNNFAQKQIEESLGLPAGSFTPDASIARIMERVGVSQFTKAFRINVPNKNAPANEVLAYLRTHVLIPQDSFRPSSFADTYYFASAVHQKNASLIDNLFKLTGTDATRQLLTGAITTGEYIQLVKENQLGSIDPAGFAAYLLNGQSEGSNVERAKYLAGFIQGIIHPEDSVLTSGDALQQYEAYTALRELTNYDVDDKLGLNPGTIGNLILHPDHARSILISQGIREVSDQLLGPKTDLTDPNKINFYNDLGFLIQYAIPDFNPIYATELIARNPAQPTYLAQVNPGDNVNACVPPTTPTFVPSPQSPPDFTAAFGIDGDTQKQQQYIQDAKSYQAQVATHNEYVRVQTQYQSAEYQKTKRSACQDFVAKSFLSETIRQLTTVRDQDSNQVLAGISLKPYQTEALLKGDPKIFTAIGLAFSVNQLNAQRDGNDVLTALLPPQFQVSYQEIFDATFGNATERNKAAFLASIEFEKNRLQIPDKNTDPVAYATYQDRLLSEQTGFVFETAADFREQFPDVPDPTSEPEQYRLYVDRMTNYIASQSTPTRPAPGTAAYDQYVQERTAFIAQKEADVKVQARKSIQYKYMDAQLSVLAGNQNLPPIPAGFTQAVFAGTAKERNNMLVAYGLTYLLQSSEFKNSDLARNPVITGTLTNLLSSNDPDRFELANIEDTARGQLTGLIDGQIAGILARNNIPAALLPTNFSQEMSRALNGDTPRFDKGAAQNALLSFADQRLGLPSGSSKAAYDLGQKISSGAQVSNADVTQVALVLFSKQLAKLDADIGLPPGSLSAIISAVITPTPISVAVAVFTIVFGYSKVELQMICPPVAPYPTANLSIEEVNNIPYQGFHEYWCKETQGNYELWAQFKTRQLIDDLLRAGERTRDRDLAPLLIGTFRIEDVEFFNGIREDGTYSAEQDLVSIVHGINPITRGIKGVYQSDFMKDYVHASY